MPLHQLESKFPAQASEKSKSLAGLPATKGQPRIGEKWLINPTSGDCNDYTVSNRFELRKRSWPARALLLREVATDWGEHHLILVVRTLGGDLVLDNLTPQIRPWTPARYRWVRMQTRCSTAVTCKA